jgi:type II secretory pathway pseudopilin PulG
MTLLESIVATVILGLAAVGFLELFQRATIATRDAGSWSRAVAAAERSMESAVLRPEAVSDSVDGMRRRIELRQSRVPGVREIVVIVDVPPPTGARVELRRLVMTP